MEPLTLFHIVAGSAALAGGGAALVVSKGGPIHARVGTIFFAAMVGMAGSGAVIASFIPERGTAVIGLITCYLVVTSWRTARHRAGTAQGWEIASFVAALALFATMLLFSLQAASNPNGRLDSLPAAAHYPFVAITGIAALLDLNFLLRRRLAPRQRIARHLWRMCTALVIAALSFFLGQQDEFPEALQGLFVWQLPGLLTLAAMIFWLFRVRFAKAWNRPWRPWRRAAPPATAVEAP